MRLALLLLALVGCGKDEMVYIGLPGGSESNVTCGTMGEELKLCVRTDKPDRAYQCAQSVKGDGFSGRTYTRVCTPYTAPPLRGIDVQPERAP